MGLLHSCEDCAELRDSCAQTRVELDGLKDQLLMMVMAGTFDGNMRKGTGMAATCGLTENEAEERVTRKITEARTQATEHKDGLCSIEHAPVRRLLEAEQRLAAGTKEYQAHVDVVNERLQLEEVRER